MRAETDVLKEEKMKEMEKHMNEFHMKLTRRLSELGEKVEMTRIAASDSEASIKVV